MQKTDYLKQADVQAFIDWLRPHLSTNSDLNHAYSMPGNKALAFANLADALDKYDWGFPSLSQHHPAGQSFDQNRYALNSLKKRLRDAVANDDDAGACAAAIDVMKWGGVRAHNEKWLRENQNGLASHLRAVAQLLQSGDDSRNQFDAKLRFNAGMTKVYSLLIDGFIIYDSRVAAALAWFVVKFLGSAPIPASLNFPCMPAKEGVNAKIRKVRNPARKFQGMYNRPSLHAQWNLRASWIIQAAVGDTDGTPFHAQEDPMRAVEAALFMWGYDLGENCPVSAGAGGN